MWRIIWQIQWPARPFSFLSTVRQLFIPRCFLKNVLRCFFFILDKINDQLCSRLDLLKPPPFLYAAGSSAVQVLVYTYITSTVLDLPQDLKLCPFRCFLPRLVASCSKSERNAQHQPLLACPLLILNLWKQTGAIRESCVRRAKNDGEYTSDVYVTARSQGNNQMRIFMGGRMGKSAAGLHPLTTGIRRRVEGGRKRYWMKTNKSAESGIKKGFVGGGKERKKQKRYIARRNNLASLRKRSECVWSRSIRATTGNNNNGNNKESAGP